MANPTQGNVRPMIELLTSANNNLIVVPAHRGVRALIFPVVTNFHKMARRPGGVPRQQALRNAQRELQRFVPRGSGGSSNVMSDDIIIVERQRGARKSVVSVPGRFSFADVRDARGERRIFGCHAVNPSIREIVIASPVTAKMAARVIAYIDHLGKFDGLVTSVLQRGFVMSFNTKQHERRKLATKIEWLQQHKNSEVREQRVDSPFVPKDPYSRMILADGHMETCLILDVSVSGAAISKDTIPAIGTVLAVGTITSRVVRHFDEGFAVRFIERQSRDTVEMSLADSNA